MTTANLNIPYLAAFPADPPAALQAIQDYLDRALCSSLEVEIDSSNAASISASDFRENASFVLVPDSTGPSGTIALSIPAVKRGIFVVSNQTDQPCTVARAGQTSVAPIVPAGETRPLSCDAVDVVFPSGRQNEIIAGSYIGVPGSSQVIFAREFTYAVRLKTGLSSSRVRALRLPTGGVTYNLKHGVTTIGSLTWSAGNGVPAISFTGDVDIAAGELFSIVAAASADATLGDIIWNFIGQRNQA